VAKYSMAALLYSCCCMTLMLMCFMGWGGSTLEEDAGRELFGILLGRLGAHWAPIWGMAMSFFKARVSRVG